MKLTLTLDTENMQEIGENILATLKDGQLILVIDTNQEIGPSSSGKMMGVASTGGFVPMPGGLRGNIYLGKKA